MTMVSALSFVVLLQDCLVPLIKQAAARTPGTSAMLPDATTRHCMLLGTSPLSSRRATRSTTAVFVAPRSGQGCSSACSRSGRSDRSHRPTRSPGPTRCRSKPPSVPVQVSTAPPSPPPLAVCRRPRPLLRDSADKSLSLSNAPRAPHERSRQQVADGVASFVIVLGMLFKIVST